MITNDEEWEKARSAEPIDISGWADEARALLGKLANRPNKMPEKIEPRTIHIKADVEWMKPFIKQGVALKLWLRLESNPCRDDREQKLYDMLTERFTLLAGLGDCTVSTT